MAENAGNKQQVNPVLLVICGIVVIAAAAYYFTQPKPAPTAQPTTTKTIASASASNSLETPKAVNAPGADVQKTEDGSKDATPEEKQVPSGSIHRNPFQTPSMYVKVTNQAPIVDVKKTETIKPDKEDLPKEPELRLGAIFQKGNDRVALVYFEGKGNVLRENQDLKKSGYRLTKINENSVVVVNDNGQEKVLRFVEQALKQKGGDH